MKRRLWFIVLLTLIMGMTLAACSAPEEPTEEPTEVVDDSPSEEEVPPPPPPAEPAEQPTQITGTIEVSNDLIIQVYFYEKYVYLEDLTGYITRDFLYEQPLAAQIFGPVTVTVDEEAEEAESVYSYTINLPAQPVNPINDVDGDGDGGIQVWQVVMNANLIGDPFIGDDESGGWGTVYTSATIDSENEDEINGGKLLIWASDGDQSFPTGFGDDGLLFTDDDPLGPVPAGYSVVDLDSASFGFSQESGPEMTLVEGDIQVNDLSELSWTEGFDALYEQASREYPFTEMKGLDWPAIYDQFAPRIAEAEANDDPEAYYLALRDFSWSIPDGHVGIGGDDFGDFQNSISGSYGMAVRGLDDGAVIVNILSEGGPAAEAGIEWGATILEWNGMPIADAVAEVKPYSLPFSTTHSELVQQWRYLMVDPEGTELEVTYQNIGAATSVTATLSARDDGGEIFGITSVYYGFDGNALPVEYEILDSGYGYIKLNSLSDDINLTIRLWERAIQVFIDNEVPGIIIDMRQNGGGAPIGSYLASPFVEERTDLTIDYYFSDTTGQLETFRPADYVEPHPTLSYNGQLAVLVSSACSSACENVSWVLGELEQTRIFGTFPTNGIYGEVGRGQYTLPGDYFFQIPTGLTVDLDGEIIIEGTGVVPDVTVPRTLETFEAQYVRGEDVILDFAITVMDQPLGAGIEPTGPPSFDSDYDLIEMAQTGISILNDRVREEYEEEELANFTDGQIFTYTVALNKSVDLLFFYPWCTGTDEQLADNWSKIELSFTINGEEIPLEDFGVYEDGDLGQPCRLYYGTLSDWSVGENVIEVTVTFTAPFNDGSFDYPAGTHIFEYRVYVARE